MKEKIISNILMTAFLLMAACSSHKTPPEQEPQLSEEELRLMHASRIDSSYVLSLQQPDSIAHWEGLDTLTAEAWILVEDATGMLISAKNAHQRMYPASLTKMMTCLLATEHNQLLDDTIEITKDVYVTRDCRVRLGDSYQAVHLLSEMMLLSDNVAAYALARHIGGDTLGFCQMMNSKAAYLGMDSTHFANPNGLPNDSNYSTARDLLTLARYSMCDTTFARIVATPFMDIPLTDGRHLPCKNTNILLQDYDGCIGVKTGYTRKAGSCLASAATRNGVTLFLILLKSKDYARRFAESAALLDYGFRVMEKHKNW